VSANLHGAPRATVAKLFDRGENVEWRDVRSLLEAIGTVTERHDGKLEVALGGEKEVIRPPHSKDLDDQTLVDLRRMLRRAGVTA